ncbi:DUF2934 domain-containing protein [Sphaerotilus montanus]|nr:DUF2934 domain-containing protein [Sphaerotilus montanus]
MKHHQPQQQQHHPQDMHGASHALIQKPPLAIIPTRAGNSAVPDVGREERIRQSAYALYEARGRVDGHDVDDWLIAEAQWAHAQPLSAPVEDRPTQPSH